MAPKPSRFIISFSPLLSLWNLCFESFYHSNDEYTFSQFDSKEFYPVQKDIKDHGTTFSHNELKFVEMGGCAGNWYELELAVNVLKYAHNLERLVLGPHCSAGFSRPSFQNRRQMIREKLQHEVVGRTQLILG